MGSLRLRVFAGPNGSGKSTVVNKIRANGFPRLGVYINADELAYQLKNGPINLNQYGVETDLDTFINRLLTTTLVAKNFPEGDFQNKFSLQSNELKLKCDLPKTANLVSQVLAEFLRQECILKMRDRFSFETVFSHSSKVDWMKKAKEAGYKVYLYFVSTESPEINKIRVQNRVKSGGHDVPPDTITSRYYRSLELLYYACQYAYQAYFFDTSKEGVSQDVSHFAHFERDNTGKAIWDITRSPEDLPAWFISYYYNKQPKA